MNQIVLLETQIELYAEAFSSMELGLIFSRPFFVKIMLFEYVGKLWTKISRLDLGGPAFDWRLASSL